METHTVPTRDPEQTAYFVLFLGKALLFAVALFFIVVVWDSLPSAPPMIAVNTKVEHVYRFSHHNLKYTESYRVIKSVDFEIQRRMQHLATGALHKLPSTNSQYQLGPRSETILLPAPDLKGRWCITAQVVWINGLSVADHRHQLPNTCFEVDNDH